MLNVFMPHAFFGPMNFINRDIVRDVPRVVAAASPASSLSAQRKWPIRYEAIELAAMCIDVATILLASVISALLYRIDGGWTATNVGKALGSAIVVSALFVSFSKTNEQYRPTELLVFRNQVRAVCLAWAFVFLVLAAAVGTLNIGHEISRSQGLIFALLGRNARRLGLFLSRASPTASFPAARLLSLATNRHRSMAVWRIC
jgi:hypothetical protein